MLFYQIHTFFRILPSRPLSTFIFYDIVASVSAPTGRTNKAQADGMGLETSLNPEYRAL